MKELRKIDVIYIDGTTQSFDANSWRIGADVISIYKHSINRDKQYYDDIIAHIVLQQVRCIMYQMNDNK